MNSFTFDTGKNRVELKTRLMKFADCVFIDILPILGSSGCHKSFACDINQTDLSYR